MTDCKNLKNLNAHIFIYLSMAATFINICEQNFIVVYAAKLYFRKLPINIIIL